MPREVQIDSPSAPAAAGVVVGGTRVPVITGPAGGGDLVHFDPRGYEHPAEELARIRGVLRLPVLMECRNAADCAPTDPYADGVVVDSGRLRDGFLLDAVVRCGLPVVVRRAAGSALDRWLGAADRCAAAGAGPVILCEGGGELDAVAASAGGIAESGEGTADERPPRAAPEFALLQRARQRSGAPVVVDVSAARDLVGAAVAAGADGVAMPLDATAEQAAGAVELATTLAPFGRVVQPETVGAARQAIDQVDACLAQLLERRTALAALVQRLKPVGGFAGRDREREQELVTAMARRAPRLGLARVRTIMAVVIEAGLDLGQPAAQGGEPTAGSVDESWDEPVDESGGAAVAHPFRARGPSGARSVADPDAPRAS